MPTVCKIQLDATEYKRELDDVVARTRAAQAELTANTAGASSGGAGQEAQQQVRINAESNVPEVAQEAREALDGIENAEPAITAASDVPQAAEAAENAIQGIPDANVTVTANADPRPIEVVEEHLRNLPNDRRVTVTVDADTRSLEYIPRSLQRVERGANTAGRAANSLGGEISKAGGIVSAFGGKAGGLFGGLGQMIEALSSPVAMLTTAFGALSTLTMEVWDYMTVSADEYAEKTRIASEEARKHADKVKEQDQAAQRYADRLKEIAGIENAGNSVKAETAQILISLQELYGDLGAEIDANTGKVKNLLEVEQRLNTERGKRKAASLMEQSEAYMDEARAAYMKAKGSEWSTSEWEAKGMFEGMVKSMSPEQMLRHFRELAKTATRSAEITGYADAANKLEAFIKARKEAASLFAESEKGGAAAIQAKQAEEIDRKQQTFDAAHDQLKDEQRKLEYLKLINEGRIKEANALKLINDAKKQGMELEKSDAEWIAERQGKVRMDTYYETEMDSLATKKREQELINQGLDEEAEKLRLIMELEKQGAEVSDDQVEKIMRERRELKSLQLAGGLRDQAENLRYSLMRQSGQGREAEREKALRDAEKTKGAKLSDEERQLVARLAELNYNMQNPGRTALDSIAGLTVRSNSLTARGGFASGGVAPDQDRINRAIEGHNRRIAGQMENALRLMDDIKKCLTG